MTGLTVAARPLARHRPRHARPGTPHVRRAGRRALELVVTLLVVVAVLLFAGLVLGPRTGSYQTTTMLTGSMAPAIPQGALLLDVPVPLAEVRAGDVVTFEAPVEGRPVVSHRVVAVETHEGRPALRTKGDANASVDPWLAVPGDDTAWVVRAAVPGAGTAVRWLREPARRTALAVGAPALLAVWGLLLLWRDPEEDEG